MMKVPAYSEPKFWSGGTTLWRRDLLEAASDAAAATNQQFPTTQQINQHELLSHNNKQTRNCRHSNKLANTCTYALYLCIFVCVHRFYAYIKNFVIICGLGLRSSQRIYI